MSPLSDDSKLDSALAALGRATPHLSAARHAQILDDVLTKASTVADADSELVGVVTTGREVPRSRARVVATLGIGLAAAAGLAIWLTRTQSEANDSSRSDVDQPGISATPTPISPMDLERDRLTGNKNIVPDPDTVHKIADGHHRVLASVKFCLDLQGRVTSSTLLKSSGYPAYDREILDGVKTWTYKPQTRLLCTAVTFLFEAE